MASCSKEKSWIFFFKREIEITEQLSTQETASVVQVISGEMKRERQ